ncbi:NAD binding site [Prochlorococcus marinus str. MIT 9515]|uniref:NAD binding site n=1 Tax=Prochlorococcus marinus (strain MIT 9515) TaxID=167542 RepID=A2BVI2_PROM5|nr:NAD(P)/FAD-dependent oxidoreductase [Prochlorococcus marinus]ABM71793.1 NAD binding site [Prochlorococcus marinus str. MIT 9515]
MKEFDAIIIGGGLSGSSTALNLSKKGYSVLIIEKEATGIIKPCAGGMASSMKQYLPLDIDQAIESKIRNVEFRWESSDNVNADLSGESPFWIIRREKLDQLLLDEALKNGIEILRPAQVEEIISQNKTWRIKCSHKDIYKSKYLVIADGSQSQWAGYFNLGPRKPKFANTIALRLKGLGNIPKDSVRFEFGFIKYGFAWAFPLKDSVNIGLGTFINNKLLEDEALNNKVLKSFGFEDLSFEKVHKKLRIWNGTHKLNGDRVVAVGDAASLCDPFLAEGIRPSLISSYFAAESIHQCLSSNKSDLNTYSIKINNEWGKSMAWGKRIAQIFYRFPKTGYQLGVKRKTAPKRIAQILSGQMSYEDIAKRVIKRLLTNSQG